jgi:hypothetical protein
MIYMKGIKTKYCISFYINMNNLLLENIYRFSNSEICFYNESDLSVNP